MFFTEVIKSDLPWDRAVLDLIQYRSELPTEKCKQVLQDLYKFYDHLSHDEVDASLRRNWNQSSVAIITKMEEIAHHGYGARSYLELSLARVQKDRFCPECGQNLVEGMCPLGHWPQAILE